MFGEQASLYSLTGDRTNTGNSSDLHVYAGCITRYDNVGGHVLEVASVVCGRMHVFTCVCGRVLHQNVNAHLYVQVTWSATVV